MRVCVKCGEAYVLTSSKPGYIDECGDCGAEHEVAIIGISLRDKKGVLVGIPESLLAVCDAVGVDQIAELRNGLQ
jgi:hypothetical protein